MMHAIDFDTFYNENLGLIYSAYGEYKREDMSIDDDLLSAARFGFFRAWQTWEPDKEASLSTYATKCITNQMRVFLRKHKTRTTRLEANSSLDFEIKHDNSRSKTRADNMIAKTYDTYFREQEPDDATEIAFRDFFSELRQERPRVVAHMYFVRNKTQKEIGEYFGVLQPTVSKDITTARSAVMHKYRIKKGDSFATITRKVRETRLMAMEQ